MTTRRAILIVTVGTLGDLNPFIAVASELVRRGHRVTVATLARHRRAVEDAGLAFAEAQRDWPPGSPEDPLARMLTHPAEANRILMREFGFDQLPDAIARLRPLVAGHDIVVQGATAMGARPAAELEGRRWLGAIIAPYSLPSRIAPPLHVWPPALRNAAPARKLAYFQELVAPLHAIRTRLGLPPIGAATAHLSPFGTLALFSRHLAADPGDWPLTVRVVGACRWDLPATTAELARAEAFLAAGPPPIVVTVGAHRAGASGRVLQQAVVAIGGMDARALVIGDTPEGLGMQGGDRLAGFPYLPFRPVFAGAAAIVCHTGIGTLTHALGSGRPTLAVPFPLHDQHDNALRAHRTGAAEILPLDRFDAPAAEAILRRLVADPAPRQAAARLAAAIAREGDGAGRAADAIIEFDRKGRLA